MLRPSLTFFIGNGFVLKRISAKSAYIDLEQPGRFWQFPETLRMSEMGSMTDRQFGWEACGLLGPVAR